MIRNYLVIAWRHIFKNKLYAGINILGLTVGLSVFIFGTLLVDYEEGHDTFFKNYQRIFTAGSVFSPSAAQNVGVGQTDGIYTAFAPFIKTDVPELEAVARTVRREFLLSIEDNHFYEQIRFADPELLTIFDFDYIEGDAKALEDTTGILLTESAARKYFGDAYAKGKTVTLDHDVVLHVTAVIRDLPADTHFNSSLFGTSGLEVLAPLAALNKASDYDLAGNFNNLSMGDLTYMLAPSGKSREWLQAQVDGVYDSHFPEDNREFISSMKVRSLIEANTVFFEVIGMPVLESIQILGLLVLVVAIVNYTNLATAQSLGRAREVGLRKTMGAARSQLLTQFLIESLCIVAVAMLFSLVVLELTIPWFNNMLKRGLTLDYLTTFPWILVTTVAVGLIAGAYPAYLITRASPIDALSESGQKGTKGGVFRNVMLGLQFTISIFMLSMVMLVFFQNKKVEEASNIYPKSQIVTLERLELESIQARMDTLRNELLKIPGVQNVAYSSQLPYDQSNSSSGATTTMGDKENEFMMMQVVISENFLATYDIPLSAGRNVSREIAADTVKEDVLAANVIVNEIALSKLGFGSPEEALGKAFYDSPGENDERQEPRAYTVVGVIPDQNYQGFHNQIKPMTFSMSPESLRSASIRVSGAPMDRVLPQIEAVWKDLIPDYPIQREFLDDNFAEVFQIYSAMTKALAGFAFVAMALSMIGLFGLAAFMAQSRTREIGIRKVMGASIPQIVRLLVWQFSRPVVWALLIALPLAYFASDTYLSFFAERIDAAAGIIILAGVVAVAFSWFIVALHAAKVARANPVLALRYE